MKWIGLSLGAIVLGAAACAQVPTEPAAETTTSSWYPSKYGGTDRLGAINNLTPEKTAAAAKLITRGATFSLGMITGRDTPAYGPREYDVMVLQLSDGSGTPLGANQATDPVTDGHRFGVPAGVVPTGDQHIAPFITQHLIHTCRRCQWQGAKRVSIQIDQTFRQMEHGLGRGKVSHRAAPGRVLP